MARSRRTFRAFDERWGERWKRRLVTGPGLLAITPLYLAMLPATMSVAAASDLVRRRPWTASRFAAALGVNLSMHVAAFGGVFLAWLAGGRWLDPESDREARLEQRLQVAWARAVWEASARIYEMELSVEGAACAAPGPVLLLPRHASLVDTLLPLVLVGGPLDLRLRYVMKRELLWDPVLDALGHRWPTAFVRRGAHDPRELEQLAHLLDDLDRDDAIVLFPEGTRFSEVKRARILDTLRGDPERLARAERLRHVLPPHAAGIQALLARHRGLDVVFLAHTGLEGASHFQDLLDGTLIGRKVRVALWRVPRAEIPDQRAAQLAWLHEQWERVDRWIAEHSTVPTTSRAGSPPPAPHP